LPLSLPLPLLERLNNAKKNTKLTQEHAQVQAEKPAYVCALVVRDRGRTDLSRERKTDGYGIFNLENLAEVASVRRFLAELTASQDYALNLVIACLTSTPIENGSVHEVGNPGWLWHSGASFL